MSEEIPDTAYLDYWVGGAAMFFGANCFLFESLMVFGAIFQTLGILFMFGLQPAQYLIGKYDENGVWDARLYRPNPAWKPMIFRDEIVSGPYSGLELKLLKLDLE